MLYKCKHRTIKLLAFCMKNVYYISYKHCMMIFIAITKCIFKMCFLFWFSNIEISEYYKKQLIQSFKIGVGCGYIKDFFFQVLFNSFAKSLIWLVFFFFLIKLLCYNFNVDEIFFFSSKKGFKITFMSCWKMYFVKLVSLAKLLYLVI